MDGSLFIYKNPRVRYWTYGDPNKPVVVILHGLRGTHEGLRLIVEQMKDDFFLIVPDLPGFGESEAFEDGRHDIAAYARFLEDFTISLSSKFHLLGHSFGSIIASHFAANNPERIDRMVLINTVARAPIHIHGLRGLPTLMARLYYWPARHMPEQLARIWLGSPLMVWMMTRQMVKSKDPAVMRYALHQHLTYLSRFKTLGVVFGAFDTSIRRSVGEVADKIVTPTLLIAGEKDEVSSVRDQEALRNTLMNAELITLSGVGHLIHYEKPVEAALEATRFFRADDVK